MKAVLGVGGGIAAYKAAELARALQERGVSVQVVMTAAAEKFITPLTFAALTGRKVITSLFTAEYGLTMGSQTVMASKGGTNQFHGDIFYEGRNSALDARNFFDSSKADFSTRFRSASCKCWAIRSGWPKNTFNSLRAMFSRSVMGILLEHFRQKYFGLLAATYILCPQEQCAKPLNKCTGGLPGFFHDFNCSSMIWFT